MKRALVLVLAAGCASFEDPTIVRDLRVLSMTATMPEQVIDFSLETPPTPAEVLAQLQPVAVLATVADPGQSRSLRWSMTACVLTDDDRCDDELPQLALRDGVIADPDVPLTTGPPPPVPPNQPWAIVPNAPPMDAILLAALDADPLRGLGGVDFGVVLRIGGVGADPALDQYAAKTLRISARIPVDRTPNQNPLLADTQYATDGATFTNLPPGPCPAIGESVATVPSGGDVTFYPDEVAGTRETYYAPTLDGSQERLEETLTYQWLGTGGSFSDAITGGGHDIVGNQSLLGTVWHTPEVSTPTSFNFWVIQRDERLGSAIYPFCVLVSP